MSDKNESDNKLKQLNSLHSYIDNFRIIKTDNSKTIVRSTHVSMGTHMGSYNISDDKIIHFFKHYQKTIKLGSIPNLLETHLDQGPILIDLDFKYTLNSTSTNIRIYTEADIKQILNIYNQVILTYLSINEDDLNIYIMEKPVPKIINNDLSNNKITYKDGLHIMYPFICVNNKVQLFFRELVVNKLIEDKILDHLGFDNSIDDIVDRAVIERNNWLLYGSGKDSNPDNLYKLKNI
jgi:hypothetical protein